MSPSATTWYVATAIDNSAGPNSGCAVKDSVEILPVHLLLPEQLQHLTRHIVHPAHQLYQLPVLMVE